MNLMIGSYAKTNFHQLSDTTLYEMSRDWRESEATWESYAAGRSWAGPGAMGQGDRGTAVLGTAGASATGPHSIVLNQHGIALLQSGVDGSKPNFGVIIADSQASDSFFYISREAAAATQRPRLEVTYSLPFPRAGTHSRP